MMSRLSTPGSLCVGLCLSALSIVAPVAAQAACPVGALATAKNSQLFLWFPTTAQASYPEHGTFGVATSPLAAFNVSDLDSGIGTTAQLRNRIFDLVTDDYCEFSINVVQTTTTPPQTDPRWQIVGVGSDGSGVGLFGEAQAVDTNNADPQDFARVWADTFGQEFGGAGGALNGANSTLERWATAIAGTTSHEAAHNYGAAHSDSAPRPGEDQQNNHIMATGSTGLTGETRAGRNRHFSDREYETLAHGVGLNAKTLWNWDFVNPNSTNANRLVLKILSTAPSLTIAWSYNGSLSPWTNPTITNTGTTESFQGTTYNVYRLEFATPKSWSGGGDGIAPAGVKFHVGASFTQSNPLVVAEARLFNGATALALFPRTFGFDAGAADLANGDFNIRLFNLQPASGPLILRRLELVRVPRMIDLETMVTGARISGLNRVPLSAQPEILIGKGGQDGKEKVIKETLPIRIGNLAGPRTLDVTYGPKDCPKGSIGKEPRRLRLAGAGDSNRGELKYCRRGTDLSLFPATYSYLVATMVDPSAKVWNRELKRFITGPLELKTYYQIAGFKPDFNRNGVDDLLDIRTKTSKDRNRNGIPDEAEPQLR